MAENDETEGQDSTETEEPETATETETDPAAELEKWKSLARKNEEQAKKNADAARKLEELEDAQKTEQERLTEKLSSTEKRAAEAELKAARLEVASEKGLPKSSVKFLTGSTPEELEESADELLALLTPEDEDEAPAPSRRPREDLKPGTKPSSEPEVNPSELADSILNEGRL